MDKAPSTFHTAHEKVSNPVGIPAGFDFGQIGIHDKRRTCPSNALSRLMDFQPKESDVMGLKSLSESKPMPSSALDYWSSVVDTKLPEVFIHDDPKSELVTETYGAEAVTFGNHIYLSQDSTPDVMAHEIAHVAQSSIPGKEEIIPELEREAFEVQRRFRSGLATPVISSANFAKPMLHPAISVLKRAGRWLARRTVNTISKHVARHGRRIAGRAVHSIFKNPREIKSLVSRAVDDGIKLAEKATTHSADDVLEEGGVRVVRQATGTPGKFRVVVEKDFGREIGTAGETIIRVVLDMSGRVVTAFPVERFLAIGLGVVALDVFTERTAEASERIHSAIEREENKEMSWPEAIIDFIFAPSTANEGEDLLLEIDRIVHQTTLDVIAEIEESEGIILDDFEREAIQDLVAEAIGNPMVLQEESEE